MHFCCFGNTIMLKTSKWHSQDADHTNQKQMILLLKSIPVKAFAIYINCVCYHIYAYIYILYVKILQLTIHWITLLSDLSTKSFSFGFSMLQQNQYMNVSKWFQVELVLLSATSSGVGPTVGRSVCETVNEKFNLSSC